MQNIWAPLGKLFPPPGVPSWSRAWNLHLQITGLSYVAWLKVCNNELFWVWRPRTMYCQYQLRDACWHQAFVYFVSTMVNLLCKQNAFVWYYGRRATRGGIRRIFPFEIFKTFHSNFDICRNFQIIKMKFCILIILQTNFISIFLCPTRWLSPYQIYLEICHLIENFGAGIVKTWEFV